MTSVNWAVVVVAVGIAIYKHVSFGSVIFLLIPIMFALLSRIKIQSEAFSIIARVVNGIFALLCMARLLSLSPYAPALSSLSLFVMFVAVPAFNVVFLSPAGEE